MPLDDQDKAVITELIAAGLKTQMESLTPTIAESIERSVKGNKTDLKGLEQKFEAIASQVGQLKTEIPTTVKANFDSLLEELGEQIIKEESVKPSSTNGDGAGQQQQDDIEARIAAATAKFQKEQEAKLKTLQNRLTEAEKIAEQERQAAAAVKEQERVNAMRQSVVKQLSGKVISGKEERALRALLEEGRLVEDKEAGQYKLKAADKYGEPVLLPLDNEAFISTLQTEFSEFIPARAGTGTGATVSHNNAAPVTPRYVQEGATAQSLLSVANDDNAFKESVRELEQILA